MPSPALTNAVEAIAPGSRYRATISPLPVNGSRSGSRSSRDISTRADRGSDLEVGCPGKIYSLPEGWETSALSIRCRRAHGKGNKLAIDGDSKKDLNPIVYLSPMLPPNFTSSSTTISVSDVVRSPFPTAPTSLLSPPPLLSPAAKEVSLL